MSASVSEKNDIFARRLPGWVSFDSEILRGPLARVIGPHGWLVYSHLLTLASTPEPAPSVRQMAETLGISERQVHRSLKVLSDVDLIRIEARWREDGAQLTNVYTLLPLVNNEVAP